ncbi:GNAT family N-acetyltransferase [Carboxylicivirga linearis]|uniref:GNAT family N-acetyltransferase n=1 Tax=Carboxylicivirga linearis TaxID=1628157 RepID=A0ABS5JVX6_9BACT|nr:GNAT family N-acetyltransferase [Carboxylicivirga linearis]MBS2099063.1 GNAT family N-acetyltransferase [Carboxylicivirga linearis]
MIYEIIKTPDQFISLREDWKQLLEKCEEIGIYQTFEFIYQWYCSVEPESEPRIITVSHNTKIVGIAPLCIQNKKRYKLLKYRELMFLGWGDYKSFLYDQSLPNISAIFKTFFQAIEAMSDEWDKLVLKNLRQDSYLTYFLKKTPYHANLRSYNEAPFITKRNYQTFDDYLQVFKDKRIIANEKRLLKSDPFIFVWLEDVNSIELNEVMDLHIAERNQLNAKEDDEVRTSPFVNSRRKQFHLNLLSQSERLSIAALRRKSDQKIIAYELLYTYKGILYCWNIGYDPGYANYGVLRILNKHVVRYFIESGQFEKYDYGSGAYRWKYQNTNEFCLLYRLEKFSRATKLDLIKSKVGLGAKDS